jgi:hypothetical protein
VRDFASAAYTVALANKMARIVWAVMVQGQNYRQAVPA